MAIAVRISITQIETTSSTTLKPGVPERVALCAKVVSSFEGGTGALACGRVRNAGSVSPRRRDMPLAAARDGTSWTLGLYDITQPKNRGGNLADESPSVLSLGNIEEYVCSVFERPRFQPFAAFISFG